MQYYPKSVAKRMNEQGDKRSERDTWTRIVDTVTNTPKSIIKSIKAKFRSSGAAKHLNELNAVHFEDKEHPATKVFGTDREITLPTIP
nr:unnamed protein product [Callosobruchus analis]